jgi:Flp pilus assembly protein TadB
MNGKDFISVLEYMKAFNKPQKAGRRKASKNYGDIDLVALLHKKQEELALFEHWMKQQDKLRKEEKKEEKKSQWLSMPQLAFILVASFPITAPMYVAWIRSVLH